MAVEVPLAIDLYCGLGGWADGLLAEGYDVVGFDIERHQYGNDRYPGQLVLQDARTLHGSQFAQAAVIVASPPCTEPSFRAQPWKRAKAKHPSELGEPVPEWWSKPESKMDIQEIAAWRAWKKVFPTDPPHAFIELFETCFRIQREASEAAGRHIPLIVENVKGAQPWVGRAAWHFGSFYLWGDVPALMPPVHRCVKGNEPRGDGDKPNGTGATSWFFQQRSDPRDSHGAAVTTAVKIPGQDWIRFAKTGEVSPNWTTQAANGTKVTGHVNKLLRDIGPRNKRKEATARIAKIPLPLSRYIAQVFMEAAE